MSKLVHTAVFNFSPNENGGEGLTIKTDYHDNGDGVLVTQQTLTLQSYGNSASINLSGIQINSEILAKLLLHLEVEKIKATEQMNQLLNV